MDYKKKIAIMYDFDLTLSDGYMQNFDLMKEWDTDVNEYWKITQEFAIKNNMDVILSNMYYMLRLCELKKIKPTKQLFVNSGKNIKLFNGVEDWFSRITEYGKSKGLEVEHYIISSGFREIIEGCPIANNFKRIFASSYIYDENDVAVWPCNVVNYTTKTQYIFRIKKQLLDDLWDGKDINDVVDEDRKVPYANMIYFGDGETDIPCMKLLKDKGGNSICVYKPNEENAKKTAQKIYDEKRVNYVLPADYSANSQIDETIKKIIDGIAKTDKK